MGRWFGSGEIGEDGEEDGEVTTHGHVELYIEHSPIIHCL